MGHLLMIRRLLRVIPVLALMTLAACVTVPAEAAVTEFQLRDMQANGGIYDSNAHLGKPMVIEFFFNSCPYCNDNVPNVKQLVSEYHPDKAQVVEVSIDDERSEYDKWIAKHHPTIPVLDGSDQVLTRWFGVRGYPTTVVLDKNHNLIWKTSGVWSSATKVRIRAYLDANQ